MVITCELRQTPGWFNQDTISGAYKCSDSLTEIRLQSLIGYEWLYVKSPVIPCYHLLQQGEWLKEKSFTARNLHLWGGGASVIKGKLLPIATPWGGELLSVIIELLSIMKMKYFNNEQLLVAVDVSQLRQVASYHWVDILLYREFIKLKNYALTYSRWNFCEIIMNDNKAIPENLVVVH